MAYSVTDCVLETKTIPESYVVLRDVPRVPYGQPYQAPEKVSAALSKNVTAVIIENDTVLATGGSIHQAFDRLEVADFTAASLINSLNIGEVVPIGQEEIEDLKVRFFGSAEQKICIFFKNRFSGVKKCTFLLQKIYSCCCF